MKSQMFTFCAILLVSACSNVPANTATPTVAHTSTAQPTETPQPTPTYLSITPALQGTQLPEHGNVISLKNIDRLTLLSRWGKGNPSGVIYTPDGKYFVTGTSTGLYFYNPGDYSLLHFIDTQSAVFDIAVSPDSQIIAAVGTDKVLLYQIPDWQLISSIAVAANSIDFSPDGQTLALGINSDQDSLQLRNTKTGAVIGNFKNEQAAWGVKISPRGDVIATGGYSTTIWSLDGALLDQYGPYVSGGSTASVSFSPDGELLAEGADNFHIWRVLENGRIINFRDIDLSQFEYPRIFEVAISPNGKMVAAALSAGIAVWDLSSGKRIFNADAKDGFTLYNSMAWSMDSSTVAVASNKTGVELWQIGTAESSTQLNTPAGSFSALAWSPDGQKLASGAEEGIAYIIDTQDGTLLDEFGSGYELNSLAFSPDGQTLALGYGDRSVHLWNLGGTAFQTLEGFGFGAADATFSADGSLFAAISPESWQTPPQVRIWNTSDWSVEKVFPVGDRDNYMITGFALSPRQDTGAISYVDMHGYHTDFINIVSIEDGTTLSTLEPKSKQYRVFIDAMAYSPDSSLLAALVSEVDDPKPRILVWQTSSWSLLFDKAINAGPRLGFSQYQQDALTWSRGGDLLAIGLKDGSTQVLRSVDGEMLVTLHGHTMQVTGVSFSPDGRSLASISLDGTLRLWGAR